MQKYQLTRKILKHIATYGGEFNEIRKNFTKQETKDYASAVIKNKDPKQNDLQDLEPKSKTTPDNSKTNPQNKNTVNQQNLSPKNKNRSGSDIESASPNKIKTKPNTKEKQNTNTTIYNRFDPLNTLKQEEGKTPTKSTSPPWTDRMEVEPKDQFLQHKLNFEPDEPLSQPHPPPIPNPPQTPHPDPQALNPISQT